MNELIEPGTPDRGDRRVRQVGGQVDSQQFGAQGPGYPADFKRVIVHRRGAEGNLRVMQITRAPRPIKPDSRAAFTLAAAVRRHSSDRAQAIADPSPRLGQARACAAPAR